jgi:regulatory protein
MECVADEKFDIEQAAIRLLSVTEHTTLQLQRKLQKKGFDAEEVAEVLADLAGRKLLSDERFASQYLVMRSARGYGPLRIAQEMREKGVPDSLVEEALANCNDDWAAVMQQVVRKKFGPAPANDYTNRAKRARFLEYRGFPSSLISRYLFDSD